MSTLRISSILILNNFDRMFHYKPSSYWGTTMAMETPKLEAPVTPEVATKTLLGDLKGLSQEGFTGLPLTSPKATRDSGNLPIFRRFPGQSEQFQTSPLILPLKVETSKLSWHFPKTWSQTFSLVLGAAAWAHLWRPWSYLSAVSPHPAEMNRTPENCWRCWKLLPCFNQGTKRLKPPWFQRDMKKIQVLIQMPSRCCSPNLLYVFACSTF